MLNSSAVSTILIIIGIIAAIALLIFSIKNSYVSSIISVLISIAFLICIIVFRGKIVELIELIRIEFKTEESSYSHLFAFIGTYCVPMMAWTVYYTGEGCFEAETEYYLILGTLMESTESAFGSFCAFIFGTFILTIIICALTVWVGGFFIYILPAIMVLASVIRLIRVCADG